MGSGRLSPLCSLCVCSLHKNIVMIYIQTRFVVFGTPSFSLLFLLFPD